MNHIAISDEAIRDLIERILPHDTDDAAKALTALIYAVAYTDNFFPDRDNIAVRALDAAYVRTVAFSKGALAFLDEARAEFADAMAKAA